MNMQVINQTSIRPLIGYDLRTVGRYFIGPCPFCGGVDRFTIKRTPQGDRWLCRKCGDGKYHDVVDFVMRRDDCDFKQALHTLGQGVPVVPLPRLKPPEAKPMGPPSQDWQRQAWRAVDRMSDALILSDQGKAGRDYLASRGLTKDSFLCWHLGFGFVFDPVVKAVRAAISIPWIVEADSTITGVKYRFIDGDPEDARYMCMPGSVLEIFGNPAILSTDQALLLVEGEINAISIAQCRPRGVSVVSFGSEPEGEIPEARAAILRSLARNYKKVIVWMDDANRSKAYQTILSRSCHKLVSPKSNGDKLDANRLLQTGDLPAFIREVIGTVPLNFQDSAQGYEVTI